MDLKGCPQITPPKQSKAPRILGISEKIKISTIGVGVPLCTQGHPNSSMGCPTGITAQNSFEPKLPLMGHFRSFFFMEKPTFGQKMAKQLFFNFF
jgi:hypothetical protein